MRMSSAILLATESDGGECLLPVEYQNESELSSTAGCTACISGVCVCVCCCIDAPLLFEEMIAMTKTHEYNMWLHCTNKARQVK